MTWCTEYLTEAGKWVPLMGETSEQFARLEYSGRAMQARRLPWLFGLRLVNDGVVVREERKGGTL